MSPRRAQISRRTDSLEAEAKALRAREAVLDKRAIDPVLLDMRGITLITDFFLICSGRSSVHIRALGDAVLDVLGEVGIRPHGVEGREEARWVLLDFGDLIVHIFSEEDREFYALERLWIDAPRVADAATAQA